MTTLKRAVSMAAEMLPAPLPHWDMTPIFPDLLSPEFEEGFHHVTRSIDGLTELFDRDNVRLLGPEERPQIDEQFVALFEEVISRFNAVLDEYRTISAYIQCILSTNTRDGVALRRSSEMQAQALRISQLGTRWTAWVGSLDVEALIERSQLARDHTFNLRKAHRRAKHLMSPAEENLASELHLSGGSGWEKLHMTVSSQISVAVEMPAGEGGDGLLVRGAKARDAHERGAQSGLRSRPRGAPPRLRSRARGLGRNGPCRWLPPSTASRAR